MLEAFLVTLLWSSSYVLITIGLEEIPALTFAGLRYGIAAIVLVPLFLHEDGVQSVRTLTRRDFTLLLALGFFLYAVTQGAQFVALQYLKAATVSLILTFTPLVVAGLSIPLLDEHASRRQWLWMMILFAGVAFYFYPFNSGTLVVLGLGIMVLGLVANALGAIIGRDINRDESISAVAVTTVSMGFGATLLLGTGLAVQGVSTLSIQSWFIILWLALVNTAFAFTLRNRTLQTLSATESSVINNTILAQVAIFGWVFLGETLTGLDVIGLAIVLIGALFVQVTD